MRTLWKLILCNLIAGIVSGCFLSGGDNRREKDNLALSKAKLASLRWVAYAPTGLNPESHPQIPAASESIRADLRVLKPYFDGLVTYGLGLGQDQIPWIARQEGFQGVIVGLWDPKDKSEIAKAKELARQGLLDGVCIGNEGLDVRYGWPSLDSAYSELHAFVLATTSEEIHDYGEDSLIRFGDFLFPNIHPWWNGFSAGQYSSAADWVERQVQTLHELSGGKLILVKETGYPSGGATGCNEEIQGLFWESLFLKANRSGHGYVFFEAFDAPWKHAHFGINDVEPYWGAFHSDRTAKTVVRILASMTRRP